MTYVINFNQIIDKNKIECLQIDIFKKIMYLNKNNQTVTIAITFKLRFKTYTSINNFITLTFYFTCLTILLFYLLFMAANHFEKR